MTLRQSIVHSCIVVVAAATILSPVAVNAQSGLLADRAAEIREHLPPEEIDRFLSEASKEDSFVRITRSKDPGCRLGHTTQAPLQKGRQAGEFCFIYRGSIVAYLDDKLKELGVEPGYDPGDDEHRSLFLDLVLITGMHELRHALDQEGPVTQENERATRETDVDILWKLKLAEPHGTDRYWVLCCIAEDFLTNY